MKTGKVLFITLLFSGNINGGFVYRKAIGKALALVFSPENVDIITSENDSSIWNGNVVLKMKHFSSVKEKMKNLLQCGITQISDADIEAILSLIKEGEYDYVFMGCSEAGRLIKELKKTSTVIVTFYNDIIAHAVKVKMKKQFKFSYIPIALAERKAEKVNARLSDYVVVLNERDNNLLKKYWKREADAIIPLAVDDMFDSFNDIIIERRGEKLSLLFVGSYEWYPNVEGVEWFCRTVMSRFDKDVVLYIAGFNMEKLVDIPEVARLDNIVILGTVENLNYVYGMADVVVAPILSGTGMKTKTAEAFMHGKYFLGTKEACEGYQIDEKYVCNDEEIFYQKISWLIDNVPTKFLPELREEYINCYSVEAMANRIRELICEY